DDQVLQAAGDEEFAVAQEAEVAGAQETAVPAVDPGAEGLAGGQGVAPVAPGDARAADADLADLAVGQFVEGVGVGDDHGHAGTGTARADGRRVGRAGVRAAVVGPQQGGRGAGPAGGDHEGGLGQPVARGERLGADPGRCEGVGEAAQGGRPDRFGAVEGDPPAAEVQVVGEGGRGVLQGEFVGEVGGAAG